MQRGLAEERAWASANNGSGPWWNAGASHMNEAFRAAFFANLGLPSLLMEHRRLNRESLTAGYGTVRRVAWEDGGGNPASYPIFR